MGNEPEQEELGKGNRVPNIDDARRKRAERLDPEFQKFRESVTRARQSVIDKTNAQIDGLVNQRKEDDERQRAINAKQQRAITDQRKRRHGLVRAFLQCREIFKRFWAMSAFVAALTTLYYVSGDQRLQLAGGFLIAVVTGIGIGMYSFYSTLRRTNYASPSATHVGLGRLAAIALPRFRNRQSKS